MNIIPLLQDQFIFIHDVILESVMCGDTQVKSCDLRPSIRRLTDKDVKLVLRHSLR